MGPFSQPITLHSASGDYTEQLDALVDTGTTFTIVPTPILERVGVVPHQSARLRLANGQIDERAIGRVSADLNGESEIIICGFGERNASAVIGAVTLGVYLLGVDPVGQRLVPVEGYWL